MENFKEKKFTKIESFEPNNQDMGEGVGETLLQLAGFIPVIGEIADVILIVKYYKEDRKIEAGLMLFALIPTFGDFLVKPFLRLGRAGGAFKSSQTFLKFLSTNPAAKQAYSKIGKQLDNPKIAQLIGQVSKSSPANGAILKNAQNLQKGLFSKVSAKVDNVTGAATKALDRGVGKSVKQNFQAQALQKYLIRTGGKAPGNFISRWYNVVYKGGQMRREVVRRLIMGSNLLSVFGFPNIQSFEKYLSNPESNPELAEKMMQNPEFANIYNNSTNSSEKSSLETQEKPSEEGIGSKLLNLGGGVVGLNVLKSLARFV